MGEQREQDDGALDRGALGAFAACLEGEVALQPGWPDLKVLLAELELERAARGLAEPDAASARGRAEALLLAALERNPGYLVAHLSLVSLYATTGRQAEARAAREALEQRHPGSLAAEVGLALVAWGLARPDEASSRLARLFALQSPDATGPRLLAARAVLASGEAAARQHADLLARYPALAAAFTARRFGGPPGRGQALRRLALFLAQREEKRASAAWLDEALARDLDLAGHHATEGELAFADGEVDRAVTAFRAALEVAPEFARARVPLALALGVLERLDEAIDQLEEAVRRSPHFPDVHYHLGVLRADRGEATAAGEAFERALALHPGYADALYALGLVRAGQGREAEALSALQRARDAGIEHVELRAELAWVRFLVGDDAGAEAELHDVGRRDAPAPQEGRGDDPVPEAAWLVRALLAERTGDLVRAGRCLGCFLDQAEEADDDAAAGEREVATAVPSGSALAAPAARRLAEARALARRLAVAPDA